MRRKEVKIKVLLFLIYIIFGIYFLNFQFPLLEVPSFVVKFNNWIVFFGGILLLISAFKNLRRAKTF